MITNKDLDRYQTETQAALDAIQAARKATDLAKLLNTWADNATPKAAAYDTSGGHTSDITTPTEQAALNPHDDRAAVLAVTLITNITRATRSSRTIADATPETHRTADALCQDCGRIVAQSATRCDACMLTVGNKACVVCDTVTDTRKLDADNTCTDCRRCVNCNTPSPKRWEGRCDPCRKHWKAHGTERTAHTDALALTDGVIHAG